MTVPAQPGVRWSDITDEQLDAIAREHLNRERAAQGLPPTIDDPAVIARLNQIVTPPPAVEAAS